MKEVSDGEFVYYIMFALSVCFVISLLYFGILLGQWSMFFVLTVVLVWQGLMLTYIIRKSKKAETQKANIR
jgi:membrane protein implicated in regulation of membrane protease activity